MVPAVGSFRYSAWRASKDRRLRSGSDTVEVVVKSDATEQSILNTSVIAEIAERWAFGQGTWTIAKVLDVPEHAVDRIVSSSMETRHG